MADDAADLLDAARGGDRAALARLLSLVERGGDEARAVGRLTHPAGGAAYTVGITGAPGAGKSTLTNALLARRARGAATRSAVLAIDPSSPFTGGAILGDRVRMQDHATRRRRVHPLDGHPGPPRRARRSPPRGGPGARRRRLAVGADRDGRRRPGRGRGGRRRRHHGRGREPGLGRRRAGQQGRAARDRRRVRDQQGRPARRRRDPARPRADARPAPRASGWRPPIARHHRRHRRRASPSCGRPSPTTARTSSRPARLEARRAGRVRGRAASASSPRCLARAGAVAAAAPTSSDLSAEVAGPAASTRGPPPSGSSIG